MSKQAYQEIMQQYGSAILPSYTPESRYVTKVMQRLIRVIDAPNTEWEVHVIRSKEANAFVLPGGKVFVFTGILPVCKNEDGLGTVLAHETAHHLARHSAERLSMAKILELGLFAVAVFVDPSPITRWVANFLLSLPYSRKLESEADHIGLLVMAQACMNIEEAPHLWERMEKLESTRIPEFISTHPSPKHRIAQLQGWMDQARLIQEQSDCLTTANFMDEFKKNAVW